MASIEPLSDKIAILPDEVNNKLASGIELPSEARKTTTQTGTVVAVGDGFVTDTGTRIPPTVKQNDRVVFSMHSGAEVDVDGTTYILINEGQILARIKE